MERWRGSGLSIRAFCRAEGIAEPRFYWWRRELAQREQKRRGQVSSEVARRGSAPAESLAPKRRRRRSAARKLSATNGPRGAAGFVPVTLSAVGITGPQPESTAAYEVHLPGDVRVLVHATAGESLADVLAAVDSRSNAQSLSTRAVEPHRC
jgi:hypothetical protein